MLKSESKTITDVIPETLCPINLISTMYVYISLCHVIQSFVLVSIFLFILFDCLLFSFNSLCLFIVFFSCFNIVFGCFGIFLVFVFYVFWCISILFFFAFFVSLSFFCIKFFLTIFLFS